MMSILPPSLLHIIDGTPDYYSRQVRQLVYTIFFHKKALRFKNITDRNNSGIELLWIYCHKHYVTLGDKFGCQFTSTRTQGTCTSIQNLHGTLKTKITFKQAVVSVG